VSKRSTVAVTGTRLGSALRDLLSDCQLSFACNENAIMNLQLAGESNF